MICTNYILLIKQKKKDQETKLKEKEVKIIFRKSVTQAYVAPQPAACLARSEQPDRSEQIYIFSIKINSQAPIFSDCLLTSILFYLLYFRVLNTILLYSQLWYCPALSNAKSWNLNSSFWYFFIIVYPRRCSLALVPEFSLSISQFDFSPTSLPIPLNCNLPLPSLSNLLDFRTIFNLSFRLFLRRNKHKWIQTSNRK